MDLDPLAFVNSVTCARYLNAAGRHAEALAFSERALRLQVDDELHVHWAHATALWGLGRRDEAVEAAWIVLRSARRGQGDIEALWILHEAGYRAEAAALVKELEGKLAAENYLRGFNLVAAGRFDDAWPFLQPSARVRALPRAVLRQEF